MVDVSALWGAVAAMGALVLTMLVLLVQVSYRQGGRDMELRVLQRDTVKLEKQLEELGEKFSDSLTPIELKLERISEKLGIFNK